MACEKQQRIRLVAVITGDPCTLLDVSVNSMAEVSSGPAMKGAILETGIAVAVASCR
jgi:hypothetical protein